MAKKSRKPREKTVKMSVSCGALGEVNNATEPEADTTLVPKALQNTEYCKTPTWPSPRGDNNFPRNEMRCSKCHFFIYRDEISDNCKSLRTYERRAFVGNRLRPKEVTIYDEDGNYRRRIDVVESVVIAITGKVYLCGNCGKEIKVDDNPEHQEYNV
ncbi:hypothetical protein HYT45_03220 [Candidatus Uhrbacteria bacterium]|nr:hypothetical protein [Candidatus Uhrbacteria bacterium]